MKKIFYSFTIIGIVLINQACTDLDTQVNSELLPKDFYRTPDPTDQSTVPIRSNGGWNDGGLWPRLIKHDFRPEDFVGDEWNKWFGGVSACNRIIEIMTVAVGADAQVISELRALRAFYFWMLLDQFGNIPIETRFNRKRA
jgi:starch-binding outer membrane protein, SusD/RagB family